ncbi:Myosin-binding protein 2 [Bienertia sinuspersici]
MAPNKFSTMLHRRTNKVTRVLIYAFLEWNLIFLLLLNSLFSYFILKFALYFGLKPPCFLCSRLDHLLDLNDKHKNSNFFSYKDIICDQHAAELSKIGYCSHHRKLVESHSLCDNCSSSSSSSSSHDPEIFKSAADDVNGVKKKCSCCDEVIKERDLLGGFSDQNLLGNSDDQLNFEYQILGNNTEEEEDDDDEKKNESGDMIFEAEKEPLLNINDDDDNDKNKEIVNVGNQNLCPEMLPQHLEFYIDHDDYRLIPVELTGDSIKVENKGEELSKIIEDDNKEASFDLVFEGDELVIPGFESNTTKDLPSIQEEEEEEDENVFENLQKSLKDEEILEGSDNFELDFEDDELENQNLEISKDEDKMDDSENIELVFEGNELVSMCEIVSKDLPNEEVSIIDESQNQENEEKGSELECSVLSEEKDETAIPEITASVSEEDNASALKIDETDTAEQNQNQNQNPTDKPFMDEYEEDNALQLRDYETQNENERNQNPKTELLIEVDEPLTPCRKESHTVSDNVISETSTSYLQGCENAQTGMSYNEAEEAKDTDAPAAADSLHRKLMLLGRRESATEESLDGMSAISEQGNAGETIEKLKEDLLAERKTLRAVYKELEEERNASAIAANQTMAMITRIQEEKATMQMEALQYQRMMEEQSEYDQEALQMMNELVVKREKEKHELEKELEVYRKKVLDYEEREKMRILCRRRSRNSSASCSYGEESDGVSVDMNQEVKDHEEDGDALNSHEENLHQHQDTPTDAVLCLQDSLMGFEDERQAILEQLKVLEEKLFTLAEEEEEDDESLKKVEHFYEENGRDFDHGNGHGNGSDNNGFIHINGQQERKMNGSMPKKLLLPLFDAAESLDSPKGEFLNGNEDGLHITKFELEKKKFALEEEVDHVYERLQAFEADREFLKHCIGSLRKGDKGLDLLQEILQHLRDLKSVELQATKNMDHCSSV